MLLIISGDASLNGLGGNDELRGGSGNDTLKGGGGSDNLFGNDGDDNLFFGDFDSADGGPGDDILTFVDGFNKQPGDEAAPASLDGPILIGGEGDDTFSIEEEKTGEETWVEVPGTRLTTGLYVVTGEHFRDTGTMLVVK